MMLTSVFMLWWGLKLVATTYNQIIPEFPILSVGISYLPVPLGGGLTMLFIIERMMKGEFFQEADAETVSTLTTE
jgi:TRAP-type C4-dicarboxylate transport system permease small subunit